MSDGLEIAAAPWTEASLDDALARLDHTLHRVRAGGGVSFDVGAATPESQLLQELSGSAAGLRDQPDTEQPIGRLLDALLDQANAAVRIETKVKGQLIASTRVGVAGDTISTFSKAAASNDLSQHLASVGHTLRARHARIRTVISVFDVASKIALATGTGNPLLALPAALRFIEGVMAQREHHHQQPD